MRWLTLQKLFSHGCGDAIINFPTFQIVWNLKIDASKNALNDFFGTEEWQEVEPNAESILQYYVKRVSHYRREVDTLEVRDETNHRLYDLVFATNSKGMRNVLYDLRKKLDKIKTKDIRGLYAVVAERQTQLHFTRNIVRA